jgi:outer membrane protein assembly factor BamD (BamD/ComL family)
MLSINPGVIIVDNVWFYGDDHKMRILNTGDMVDILEDIGERYTVGYDTTSGKLEKNVLVDLNSEIGEHELFVFARGYFDEGGHERASRLLNIFTRFFDGSGYLAEALYYLAQSFEALIERDDNDTIPGTAHNEVLKQKYYNGDIYRMIVRDFPNSPFASKSQYRLVNIFRIEHLPWQDSVQIIEQELTMWEDFCTAYRTQEEYVLGLSEIGYLNRVLYEITENADYQDTALLTFRQIVAEYPNTIYAAYAKVNLYELKSDKKIYKY